MNIFGPFDPIPPAITSAVNMYFKMMASLGSGERSFVITGKDLNQAI